MLKWFKQLIKKLRNSVKLLKQKALMHSLQDKSSFRSKIEKKVATFNENIKILQTSIPLLENELVEYINLKTLTTNF